MINLNIIKRLIIESKEDKYIGTYIKDRIIITFSTINRDYSFNARLCNKSLIIDEPIINKVIDLIYGISIKYPDGVCDNFPGIIWGLPISVYYNCYFEKNKKLISVKFS